MRDKVLNFLVVVSILSLFMGAIISTFNKEQRQREKCAKVGLVYYKAHKSPAICIEGVYPYGR